MGKVMFSQVFVCLSWGLPFLSIHHWSHDQLLGEWDLPPERGWGGLPPGRGGVCIKVDSPLTYGQLTVGTHPTGMHACEEMFPQTKRSFQIRSGIIH